MPPSVVPHALPTFFITVDPVSCFLSCIFLNIHTSPQMIQHNPAISNSLVSKFRLYRSSISSPARHNVNQYQRCSVISKLGYFEITEISIEISVISKLLFGPCQSKAYRIYRTYINMSHWSPQQPLFSWL